MVVDKCSAAKNFKGQGSDESGVGKGILEGSLWGIIVKDSGGHPVDKISSCEDSTSPKMVWHICCYHKRPCNFQEMAALAFNNSILLWGVDTRALVDNPVLL